jgi:hypothetical protein
VSRVRALAALALVAGLIAGCGDDEETTTVTESVPPVSETAPPPAGPETTTTSPSGGLNPDEEDSETNDLPPEPGSAAERFENRCERKPESCE